MKKSKPHVFPDDLNDEPDAPLIPLIACPFLGREPKIIDGRDFN